MLQERHPLTVSGPALIGLEELTVRLADDCARLSLRARSIAPARGTLGLDVPVEIGRMSAVGAISVLCLGPDEWHVLADRSEAEELRGSLERAFGSHGHSLVDVSHRDVGILVDGKHAALALSSACAVDLDKVAVGSGLRTTFDKVQIVLMRTSATSFRVEVWRSFAQHVWALLETVSKEIASGL